MFSLSQHCFLPSFSYCCLYHRSTTAILDTLVTPPFFVLHLICTKSSKLVQFCQNSDKLSSTWLTLAQPGSTLLNLAQLFCSHLFTFGYPPSYLPNYLTSYLPTYLPAYPSGSLMLPNLTISLTLYYITK